MEGEGALGEFSLEEEGMGRTEELVARFEEFFRLAYEKELQEYLSTHPNARSVVVDYRKLEAFDYDLADALLDEPNVYLDAMETALRRMELPGIEPGTEIKVRLTNIPPDRTILVRNITADYIGKIIAVEGLVRQISTVMPRLVVARWACKKCGRTYDVVQEGQKVRKPYACVCGSKDFELQPDESKWVDFQRIQIQEPIEYLRGGEQARFIDVYLEGDLVNTVKPGDRVNVVGILKLLNPEGRKIVYGKYIHAIYIEPVQKEFEELEPTPEEIKKIKELAQDPEIYEKLRKSIAPTIYGHDEIKEAVALQLFGGVKKELPDRTHIRGNIHILLMGDPGTGKSQILRHVAQIAPKSIYVAGKTASGAGLTATAEKDEMGEGGWVIKAGALVLASGGIAAVDEFDKIDAKDRAALHEAMEQQSYHHDFEIMLADRSKAKIGELVDKLIEANRDKIVRGKDTEILPDPGVELLGYDLKSKQIVRVRADRVSRHIAPDHFIRIEFSNGREITVTPEHPVMIWRDGKIAEVPAERVRTGDLAVAVRRYPTLEKPFDKTLARFWGFVLSEGFTYKNEGNGYYEIGFTNTDKELVDEFVGVVKALGQKYSIQVSKRGRNKPLYTVRIISKDFYGKMMSQFPEAFPVGEGRPALLKRIPSRILGADEDAKKAFLNAYFKGDGFISPLRTGFITASRKMAEDLQDMLYNLGIYSYIATEDRAGREYYKVVISGPESLEQFYEIVKDDKRSERILQLAELARKKSNHKDPLPRELVVTLKNTLKALHIDDGVLGNNIKREQNVHRETAEKYVHLIEETIRDLENALERRDVGTLARFVQIRALAKKTGIPESTLRYRLKKKDENTVHALENMARALLERVKENVQILREYISGNIRFLRVKNVERVENSGWKWVYDVTVEPYHLFVSHGLVLHNTISVAKAGIVTTFKADTAILAAANPKHGRFDPNENPITQINIEPTILSRFDLMFIIREKLDEDRDRKIAEHVLKTHLAGEKRMAYEKGADETLTREEVEEAEKHVKPAIDIELLRKYIAYARAHVFPELSEQAMKKIADYYVKLRQLGKKMGTVPTTARQLEALIRLAEASARVRLSPIVTEEDAERAIRLAEKSMEEVLVDKETGAIDYDVLTTGTTKSKREKMKIILTIIKDYTRENDSMPYEELLEQAKELGLDEMEVNELVEALKKNGDIYEPKPGLLRPVSPS